MLRVNKTNLPEEGLSPSLRVARHQHPKFGQIMAEYSLAAVINMERNMVSMIRNQVKREWNKRQIQSHNNLMLILIILIVKQLVTGVWVS